jgi:hypothetical protein
MSTIVRGQRLDGLLGCAVADGAFPVDASQLTDVEQWELESALLAVFLERALLEVWDSLSEQRIPTRVLKGPALAHTAYPDPSMRGFGDIDILVPGADFDSAVSLLVAAGGERRYAEPRPGFTRRFGKGVALVRSDGYEVDLHRTFVAGPYGLLVQAAELFARHSSFWVGGQELLGLEREAQFVGACYHAVLGAAVPRLAPLRDVLQLVLHKHFVFARAQELSKNWHGEAVVALAIRTACDVLGVAPEFEVAQWAHAYRTTERDRRYLAAYVESSRSYARQALAGVTAVRGIRAKVSYIAALAAPDSKYLHEREGSYARRALRAGRLVWPRSQR